MAESKIKEEVSLDQEDIPTRATARKVYKSEKQKKELEKKEYIPLANPKITTEIKVKPRLSREQIEKIETPEESEKEDQEEMKKGRDIEKMIKTKKRAGEVVTERPREQDLEIVKGNCILIITEKPQAAQKIALSLSSGRARKYSANGVSYYEFEKQNEKTKENERIIVACAVGHLFSLSQDIKGSDYPVFDISWKPNFEVRKKDFTRKYYNLLGKLVKRAKEIIIATDYDIEGEVIGYNIVRFIGKQKDAKRMKFSSLTKEELEDAFKNLHQTLDWPQAISGETRHFIDWFYGINLSRALMNSIKSTGKFKIMSIGRVQGPALKLIVEKEKEISAFKPQDYWKIFIDIHEKSNKENKVKLRHVKDIFKESELDKFKNLKGKEADVTTESFQQTIFPPPPFDLTTLQTEAYKFFYINPAKTLEIAQQLYLAGLISYPRTSSQKIPEAINPKGILKKLSKNFSKLTNLAVRARPIEGKKSDPAHPAIYPTGEFDHNLSGEFKKIYELIVRRFISCFSPNAKIENKTITAIAKDEKTNEDLIFKERGLEIIEKGWMNVYDTKLNEKELKDMNGKAIIEKLDIEKDQTKPPRRFSPASIISELEKKGLGTKCLTGDTKIILNGEEKVIEEVFEKSEKYAKENDIELRKLPFKTISFNNDQKAIINKSEIISKRPLKENEKIIAIHSPSGEIKVTENHKVYTSENGKIKEISAKELNIENKLVGLLKNYKEGAILFDKSELDTKFKIRGEDVLHKFCGRSTKGIKISSFPIRWSTNLAWVLGYYYGDGSYSNPKYNGSHQLYFTTTENKALELLKENINNIFGNEPYAYNLKRKYKVNCNSAMATILIKIFPNLEGKNPIDIPSDFIGDFLRGFFDADGNAHLRHLGRTIIKGKECASYDTPRIKITLAKKELIKWVSYLLKNLGIDNSINKNKSKCLGKTFDCWTILISGRERVEKFAYKVGFDSYKEDILYKGLKCKSIKYQLLSNSARVYFKLIKRSMKPENIASSLNMSRYHIMKAIKHLLHLKLISKKRIGNRSNQKWFYFVIKKDLAYERHCIKILYKKILKGVYELPIETLSQEAYNGFVYDLSVDKDSPNFTIEGNILVHNSTRANILETLYDRNYITSGENKSIMATPLGINLIGTLEKYSPIIIDEKLTRDMEKDMEHIQESKKDLDKKEKLILDKARHQIIDISEDFKKKEEKIGMELIKAQNEHWKQQNKQNELDFKCPNCKKGNLTIKFSPKNKKHFIACNKYPACKTTFSLPPYGLIKRLEEKGEGNEYKQKLCDKCGFPLLMSIQKAKRPWIFCFNPECPSRKAESQHNYKLQDEMIEGKSKAEEKLKKLEENLEEESKEKKE